MRRLAPVLLALAGCVHASAPAPAPATVASSLTLKRFPGLEPWTLSEERGSVVVLDVWATWCEPCRETLPAYQALQARYAGRGVHVYAVNVDADAGQVATFMKELKVDLPVLLDPGGAASESTLQVQLMPTSFVFDRAGVQRKRHEGFDPDELAGLPREIEGLLAERP